MINRAIELVGLLAGLGSGLIGGVFFAFSSFVLPALARLPGTQGLVAMQSINVVVLNRSFLGAFLGTALLCGASLLEVFVRAPAPGAALRGMGAVCYLVGSLLVTKRRNVPYNDALDAVDPGAEDARSSWLAFVRGWGRWNHLRTAASLLAALCFALGTSGCARYWECAPAESSRQSELPDRLSQTGLFAAGDPARVADGVQEFAPRFELWSDGASKRRWISLPPGERIDTSDVDNWRFPVGTRFWKEFSSGGVRLETRTLHKTGTGDDDWAVQAYIWLADGSDAVAAANGAQNVLGTSHDVPSAGVCRACHGGRKSFALGFSALQLAQPAAPGQVSLAELVATGRLTKPPGEIIVPGSERDRNALGYLHANCGHCHNQDRPPAARQRCYDPQNELDFFLRFESLQAVSDTPTYQSGRGDAFEPGSPDRSRMIELMSERGFLRQMPPLGTEIVDERGLHAVRSWIAGLR